MARANPNVFVLALHTDARKTQVAPVSSQPMLWDQDPETFPADTRWPGVPNASQHTLGQSFVWADNM